MTIQDWGAIGELLGAVAVVLTLVYLSRQIKMSARTQHAQIHQQIADGRREALKMFIEFPDLGAAVSKASRGELLTDAEEELLFRFTIIAMRGFENELYLHSLGMVSDAELAVQRRLLKLPHMRLSVVGQNLDTFTPQMQAEMKEILAEIRDDAGGQVGSMSGS